MTFEPGQRVRIPHRPDLPGHVRVEVAMPVADGWQLFVEQADGVFAKVELTTAQAAACEVLTEDGAGDSKALLAGLWTTWMRAAASGSRSAALASTPLKPYAHQMNAVYGAMLPQPRLRFLLADEPGTGKTIMAGLYLREMQRLGFVRSALIVVPAHLVTKWQGDFERFFGGGLRAITAQTVREHGLDTGHDLWVVSLDLLSVNGAVQDAVHPDRMGWDAVVFDEAHRLTPTAVGYYQAGQMLALNTPRALLMTATPHRGKEWLFRALLHLVDPEVYPPVESNKEPSRNVKPGRVHFLRRMKEDLVDFDGVTKLFKGRHAANEAVPLSPVEAEFEGSPRPKRRRLRSVAAYRVRGDPCATVHNGLVSPQNVRRRSVSCQSCSATANGIVAGQGPNWRKMCGSGVRVPTGRPRKLPDHPAGPPTSTHSGPLAPLRIDPAGRPLIAGFALPAVLLALAGRRGWALPFAAVVAFMTAFFRDPDRPCDRVRPPADDVLAPADGLVVVAGDPEPGVAPPGDWQQVSIFLSPADVHMNRSPYRGSVTRCEYRPGAFLAAYRDRSSMDNERSEIWLADGARQIVFRQVVGVLARRIVTRTQVGAHLDTGQRMGLMKFGSRMDVFLPRDCTVVAARGDRVKGGQTVIARWKDPVPT